MWNIRKDIIALWLTAMVMPAAGCGAWAQGAPPAQVDRTTPHTQKGLTLLVVTRGDAQGQYTFPVPQNMDFLSGPRSNGPAGGIGLWVRGVKPPAPTPQKGPGRRYSMPYFQNPTASATALNGDALPAQVEPVSSYSYDPRGDQPAPLYLVTLPGGYPVGYPAIDVAMSDSQGHFARWRLIRLAAPYHAIAPPVAVQSAFAGAGAKLNVRAWRDTGAVPFGGRFRSYSPEMAGVHYAMTAQIPAGSNWLVRIFKRQLEWEAVRPEEIAALMARYGPQGARQIPRQILWTAAFGPEVRQPMQDMVRTPYAKYSRFLRLSGELVQKASATESVTFHNLTIRQSAPPKQFAGFRNGYTFPPSYEISAKPQTIVTPSGISISLLPLSALGQRDSAFGGFGQPNSMRMLLRFGPVPPGFLPYQQNSLALPKSPLYKKYHKPISYSLQAQRPYYLELFGGYSPQEPGMPAQTVATLQMPFSPPIRTMKNGQITFQMVPTVVPRHLDSLTLNVVQSAELRSLPISFVVPIGSQAPGQTFPAVHHSIVR